VLCAVAALGLRLALAPILGTAFPYITFFPAILLSGWAGGLEAGLAATLLGGIEARYLAIEPVHSLALPAGSETLGLVRFLGVGAFVSWLIHAIRKAQHHLNEETAKRRQTQQSLEESEERLQRALDAANEGLWDWRPLTGEGYCSPRVYALLGYETNEWSANYEAWKKLLHPDDAPSVEVQRAEQIRRQGGTFDLEYRLRKKNGDYVWIRSRGKVTTWTPEGEPARIVGTLEDITERRQLEDQFRQAQRLEGIGRLAGGIAHDFNNLLTVINGYAEMAVHEVPPDSPLALSLNEIRAAGGRAAGLTQQLLAFSRKQVLQPIVLNLNDVVTDASRMLERLIGEDISLVTRLADDLGNITADAGQLQQIIVNLAVNSRDAMPNGGRLIIETGNVLLDDTYVARHPQVRPGPHVMLAVTDSGTGMSPEVQERLFEPFFTTKPVGQGTGLGLATVYGIVKQMGGWIWVYSEPERGTAFKLYFSRTDELVANATVAPKNDLHGTESVLVTEDQIEVRTLMVTALRRYGYTVHVAADAENAIEFCRRYDGPLDLLITDVIMPGLNGAELARRLSVMRPHLRVLFISGYTDNALAQYGILGAGTDYLAKPFTPDGLVEKVRTILTPVQPGQGLA
jgi:two-component system cell cycle sensor histidine kinase/response regulator CckA